MLHWGVKNLAVGFNDFPLLTLPCRKWCNLTNLLQLGWYWVSLGGGFKYFLFPPLLGEGFQFDDHIFQMGWFNHQLVRLFLLPNSKNTFGTTSSSRNNTSNGLPSRPESWGVNFANPSHYENTSFAKNLRMEGEPGWVFVVRFKPENFCLHFYREGGVRIQGCQHQDDEIIIFC